jgi:3-(3-hydroxy-phenyl)propionate hydroxylase
MVTATRTNKVYPYTPPRELRVAGRMRHPVMIVGAGPVGLSAAIDLAMHGVRSILLDDNDVVSVGSRAICWSKRTLEIFARLGVGERMVERGVTWQTGRVYHRDRELYSFDLLPEAGHRMPAFINLQQYYVEQYLVDRVADFPELIELRWKNRVRGVRQLDDAVLVDVETPDGVYAVEASWLIAADGARSTIRTSLGLPFEGQVFEEKFLIADVAVAADYPSDRRFWFEPTFDPGQSVLIHRQPDSVLRIDFQLGWDADAETEREPARVAGRVRRVIGAEVGFELQWWSVYTFRCERLARFVHGRVLFAGDSAHVVSPFGARGGNGGIQDVDNLCWKLALVLQGRAPASLLESYNDERVHGCEENIGNSTRTTRFMTPKTQAEKELRNAVLALAGEFPFARALVNSGRLSQPCSLAGLPWTARDDLAVAGPLVPGMPCADAPLVREDGQAAWLLDFIGGEFVILAFVLRAEDAAQCRAELRRTGFRTPLRAILPAVAVARTQEELIDARGLAHQRYGGAPGVTYLIRPDQHVAARFGVFDIDALAAAHARATAGSR